MLQTRDTFSNACNQGNGDDNDKTNLKIKMKGHHNSDNSDITHLKNKSKSTMEKQAVSATNQIGVSKQRRVSFLENVLVHPSLHVDDYTDEEFDASWYTEEELEAIRNETAETVTSFNLHNKNYNKHDQSLCMRGLECSTSYGAKQKKRNYDTGLEIVLNEQYVQLEQGKCNPERTALLYAAGCADHCARVAHVMGIRDEQFVKHERQVYEKSRRAMSVKDLATKKAKSFGNSLRNLMGSAA